MTSSLSLFLLEDMPSSPDDGCSKLCCLVQGEAIGIVGSRIGSMLSSLGCDAPEGVVVHETPATVLTGPSDKKKCTLFILKI
jgi:hypothetical protein